jgi:hypothetical protein
MCALSAVAKDHQMLTGKVLSQDLNSVNSGTAVVPVGGIIAAVPIERRSNIVVVETEHHRLAWSEYGRKTLIFVVGSTVSFYQDGNWFIVLDAQGHKHKFGLIHAEALGSN